MSQAMIMRPYTNLAPVAPRRQGLGDPLTDALNTMATALTQQTRAQIDATKMEVLTEVDKQAKQAKIMAVAGGFAAGLLGAWIYSRFIR